MYCQGVNACSVGATVAAEMTSQVDLVGRIQVYRVGASEEASIRYEALGKRRARGEYLPGNVLIELEGRCGLSVRIES